MVVNVLETPRKNNGTFLPWLWGSIDLSSTKYKELFTNEPISHSIGIFLGTYLEHLAKNKPQITE